VWKAGVMPESPEVEALAEELNGRLAGRALTAVDVVEFRTTKTRARPAEALVGETATGMARHGKLVALSFGASQHLVVSFGRHGWARWTDTPDAGADDQPDDAPPMLVALGFDDGSTLELTDAGDWVSLGCWVVDDPAEVPAVAKLGPDPADPAFSRAEFDRAVAGRRKQVKAVLQDQESLAGIGNAYSDEILHAAKTSPYALAAGLSEADIDTLFAAMTSTLTEAVAEASGKPPAELKDAKRRGMKVHGRTGQPCPGWDDVPCGDTVHEVSFADSSLQYCPTCQTGGKPLADRRMSRLLR